MRAIGISLILYTIFMQMSCSGNQMISKNTGANPSILEMTTDSIISSTAEFRNFRNTKELNRVAHYIKSKMESYELSCDFQEFTATYLGVERNYKNVICRIGDGEELVVIGAHYDVFGEQDGADDNASGVSGLLELGRLLGKSKQKLPYTYELVAYTLEEPPFFGTNQMGSYKHASRLDSMKAKVHAMIALEMIGYFTNSEKQSYPIGLMKPFYPSKGDFISAVGNFGSSWISREFCRTIKDAIGCQQLNAPKVIPGVDFSDHRNYWVFGFDAIMITDTAFYRNHNYHKFTDQINTLDFEKMATVVNGVYSLIIKEF